MPFVVRLRDAVTAYPGSLWRLGSVTFINLAGFSIIWPITTIYIHQQLGRPVTVAGVVLLLYSGASSLGQLTGGALYDRLGARPVILAGLLSSAGAIALPGLSRSWPLYIGAMVIFGFTQSLVFPAVNAQAAATWPEGGRRTFNFIYVVHNAGVAVGTAVGGLVANHSFQLAFIATALSSVLAAVLGWATIDGGAPGRARAETATAVGDGEIAPGAGGAIPWVPVGSLLVSILTLWLVYIQWTGTIPVQMQRVGVPLSAYSLLWTLNGLIIVFGQPAFASLLRLVRSLASQLFLGTGLLLASFGLLLGSHGYLVFVAAMVLLTLGEMVLWPGVPAAVDQLAPPARRGFLQGCVGSAIAGGRMLGPVVGGLLYDRFGYLTMLVVMLLILALPVGSFLVYARTAGGRQGLLNWRA